MDILITPARLTGSISAISSKSDAHRALICAALCKGETIINLNCVSKDIEATVNCINSLGANAKITSEFISVKGSSFRNKAVLNCNESGSTARFLLPVAAAVCESFQMTGEGRLPSRPFEDICNALRKGGCNVCGNNLPLKVSGKLKSGKFEIPGNVSSQYISGLLFALPLLEEDSEIILTTNLESSPYVDMTINTLKAFGIEIEKTKKGFFVKGNQEYISPNIYKVEGDWSNSAFFVGANAIGNSINIEGLKEGSLQGDKKIIEIAKSIDTLTEIDVKEVPDLVPVISIMCACKEGKRSIVNAGRLRIKESDRIKSVCKMINDLGGKAYEEEDSLEICGSPLLGGIVDSENDHRIVMATAIAATVCENRVIIKNAQAVSKSYPAFFEDYKKLGGKINVL